MEGTTAGRSARETEKEADSSVVTATIPAREFALGEALSTAPEASLACERTADAGGSVFPLLWARTSDHETLEAALREDSTTAEVTVLTDLDDERLYRIGWGSSVHLGVEILTSAGATILDVSAEAGDWTVKMLFPSRTALSATKTACENHGLPLNIRTIRSMDGGLTGGYSLTDRQYRTLTAAYEEGYYNIPRATELGDLAGEMDISHQALSERMRRATGTLVGETLVANNVPSQ
jgi:predicted DNA binding protein